MNGREGAGDAFGIRPVFEPCTRTGSRAFSIECPPARYLRIEEHVPERGTRRAPIPTKFWVGFEALSPTLGMLLEFVNVPNGKAYVEGRERLLWSPRDPAA